MVQIWDEYFEDKILLDGLLMTEEDAERLRHLESLLKKMIQKKLEKKLVR